MSGASDEDGPPAGVIVCVRLRPMFLTRPDGTPAREANCKRVVEMEGKNASGVGCAVTRIFDPNDMEAVPREYAFDRSYWSCDGFMDDPSRPGVSIPDGPNSKYVSQDMVWNDVGQLMMKNALSGYNCTVFAYGQSGAGKSYSVVGYPPNVGIIPNTLTCLYETVDANTDPNVRFQVEIAMLEVYMDEVYDLLEPRKKERQKLNVFVNKGEVFIYDPKDRKNMDKIWRASKDYDQAESFRRLGDANRSVRSTGMNPVSSRGHTLFMCRFRKEEKQGGTFVEKLRSKISLVDLAGSERAHDTGLTGIGLDEGISINQSLTALGQVFVSICKGERVNYRDKLTSLLAESLGGNAVTVMIAALSPADINYNDTVSTLRFADNAKKMPVKVKKQLDPTAQLIADLQAENERLQSQLAALGGGEQADAMANEKQAYEAKLQEAERKLAEMEKGYAAMEAKGQMGGRLRLAALAFKVEDKEKIQSLDQQISVLREEVARATTNGEEALAKKAELEAKLQERAQKEAAAQQAAEEAQRAAKNELEVKAAQLEAIKQESEQRVQNLGTEVSQLAAAVQMLVSQGAEASEERKRMEEVLRMQSAETKQWKQASSEEKSTIETLLDARMSEIEQLVHDRDEAREVLKQARDQNDPDVLGKEQSYQMFEEALHAARAEYEAMETRAYDVGVGCRFNAAVKNLNQADSERKAQELHTEVERLRSSGAGEEEIMAKMLEEQQAMLEARHAAEELRIAAEAALQEKMAELQDVMRERDEARAEAMEARERLGPTEADLMERQAAIQAIIQSEQASWENKLQASAEAEQRLKRSFEDMGISVTEIVSSFRAGGGNVEGGDTLPLFVNLCEDAHEDGLIYIIPPGTTRIKRHDDDDQEPGIKLCGSSIWSHHATLTYDVSTGEVVIVTGEEGAVLWVDGEAVGSQPVRLQHGDRVIIGSDFAFRFVDPHAKRSRQPVRCEQGGPAIIDWKFAMDELARKNGMDAEGVIDDMRNRLLEGFAQREADLAEEQRLLEERMEREREQYEEKVRQLQQLTVTADAPTSDSQKTHDAAQERTQSALAQLKGSISDSRNRAQWVRSAFRARKAERFELDVRLARQQMADLQPRVVEANRISALHCRMVKYSFHLLDAVDPRARDASTLSGGNILGSSSAKNGQKLPTEDDALLLKRLLLQIKVDRQTGETQIWSPQKFLDRLVRMISFANGETLDTFFDEEDARYEDIFWDQVDHSLIGAAAVGLTPLLSQQAVRESVTLRGVRGEVRGALSLTMSLRLSTDTTSFTNTVLGWGQKGNVNEMASQLAGKDVKGEVRFGRIANVSNTWAGLFVRFSWFDTHGRIQKESPVVETADLNYTFTFEQHCTEEFVKFLASGLMYIQIRAYERCKVKDFELRDLRLKLRKAEAELSIFRRDVQPEGKSGAAVGAIGGAAAGACVAGPFGAAAGLVVGAVAGGVIQQHSAEERLKVDLANAREQVSESAREVEQLKRDLALARQQANRPAKDDAAASEANSLRRRVKELEGQMQTMTAASNQRDKCRTCVMM